MERPSNEVKKLKKEKLMSEFIPAQTSVPDWLMTYCRQLAEVHYERKLNRMYVHMVQSFLAAEPWKATPPVKWRMTNLHGTSGLYQRKGADPGWVPMNMVLPIKLHDHVKATISSINNQGNTGLSRELSLRTFLYTVVTWWCEYVYPYRGPGVLSS